MGKEIKTKQHLLKRIEAFLKDKRTKDNYFGDGCANPEDGDLQELRDIVNGITRLKFKPSWEGCLSVQAILIDRTKCKPMHFFPISFADRHENDPEAYLRSLRANLDFGITNISIATDEVNTLQKLILSEERRLETVDNES